LPRNSHYLNMWFISKIPLELILKVFIMKKATFNKVRDELLDCVVRTIERIKESEEGHRPFHGNLLSEQIIKFSAFERSFSTSLGQSFFEKISKLIAIDVDGTSAVEKQKITRVNLSQSCINQIEEHIKALRENTLGRAPSWEKDISNLINTGTKNEHRIISDLWFKRNGVEHFFSIKTVKPNLDQTSEAKRDMLKLFASNNSFKVYFALTYNPFGEKRSDYNHSFPKRLFNMYADECVLIGKDYWDFIGGPNTYKDLMKLTEDVGKDTKELLKKL
jgi:hypothetical protein